MNFDTGYSNATTDPDDHLAKAISLLAESKKWRTTPDAASGSDDLKYHRALLDEARLHLDIATALRPNAKAAAPSRNRDAPPRQGQRWEAEEEQQLCELWEGGRSVDEIAATLQRKPGGIRSRLNRLYPENPPFNRATESRTI